MRQHLLLWANRMDQLNQRIAHAVRWLALLMVAITVVVVILRYAFNVGAIVLHESVMYMHGTLFLLGIAYGIGQDTHVRVDLVYSNLSVQRKRWVNLGGHVLFLFPVSMLIFITSWPYVDASWRVFEGSSEVDGIQGIFLLKSLLPIMAGLLLLQGLSQIARDWLPKE